jgi:hypothetical protein
LQRDNSLAYFALLSVTKKKGSITLDPGVLKTSSLQECQGLGRSWNLNWLNQAKRYLLRDLGCGPKLQS